MPTTYTENYSFPIVASEDFYDQTLVNDIARIADREIAAAQAGRAARNFLDNSGFVVNQRGKTEYTETGYAYDRWRFRASNGGTVQKLEKGIRITAGASGICGVYQRIATQDYTPVFDALAVKPFTLAAKVSANTLDSSCVLQVVDSNNTTSEGSGAVTITTGGSIQTGEIGVFCVSAIMPAVMANSGINVVMRTSSSASSGYVDVEWIALYEGTYTADTLPAYKPKGYASELLECQRYLYAIDFDGATITPLAAGLANAATSLRWALDLPVPLASTGLVPSVAVGDTVVLRAYNNASYQTLDGSAVTVKHTAGNTVLLVAAGNFSANQLYLVTGHTSTSDPTKILVSNEL